MFQQHSTDCLLVAGKVLEAEGYQVEAVMLEISRSLWSLLGGGGRGMHKYLIIQFDGYKDRDVHIHIELGLGGDHPH